MQATQESLPLKAKESAEIVRVIRDDASVEPAFRPVLALAESLHRNMVRARVVSARMIALQRTDRVAFHSSSIGQEAVIVGAALAASDDDWLFPGRREWYAAIARGLSVGKYMHHAFGSAEDPAKGHSSPDHPPARGQKVVPPSGVIGAHLPQAVGAAWAAKIKKASTRALALFGSDIAETGDFHNAMNFAGVVKAPVVFVCHVPASGPKRGTDRIVDRAVAYGLASARVDGNDAFAVATVVKAALARAGEGKGATLIEAVNASLDAGASVKVANLDDLTLATGELTDFGDSDPLARLTRCLIREQVIDGAATARIAQEARVEIDAAIAAAEWVGPPKASTIFDDVYASVPAHLAAQRDQMGASKP